MYATANRYRENEILSAGPQQLLLMVYDHLLLSLKRGRACLEQNDLAGRATQFGKARAAIDELLVTLDLEQGGDIARQLSGLYTFVLAELLDVRTRHDVPRLDRLIGVVTELRGAFAALTPGADA